MPEITQEMLYAELLKLDERLQKTQDAMDELVTFMQETNREVAEGLAQTEALKKSLFGDRFNKPEMIYG